MADPSLLQPLQLGPYLLRNRVIMAPLTRMRAGAGNTPHELNAEYYRQRASAGLIIAEATQISPQGQGYPATPGIHSAEQVAGWRKVTEAVHGAGGRIFLQLWHVGRISHSSFQPDGGLPVAPSAIAPKGKTLTADWKSVPFETPRALETAEIPAIVAGYRQAAIRARDAGFDGVEVHGANGYLLDQFLQDGTNQRTDRYGGSLQNRARFLLETVDAVTEVWGAGRVGVRLSPYGTFNDMADSDYAGHFTQVIGWLSERKLGYLHLIEPRATTAGGSDQINAEAPDAAALFRKAFGGVLISAGGYTPQTAQAAVASGRADAVAFGRLFIANPDLPRRIELQAPLNAYQRATFYGGDARGYTDYPSLEAAGA
jgi:N-ethylmaleimide reductase